MGLDNLNGKNEFKVDRVLINGELADAARLPAEVVLERKATIAQIFGTFFKVCDDRQWVAWRYENGVPTPYQPTHSEKSGKSPEWQRANLSGLDFMHRSTWATLKDAAMGYIYHGFDGVGRVLYLHTGSLSKTIGTGVVHIPDAFNSGTVMKDSIREMLEQVDTYAEADVTGEAVTVWAFNDFSKYDFGWSRTDWGVMVTHPTRRDGDVEFWPVTGQHILGTPEEPAQIDGIWNLMNKLTETEKMQNQVETGVRQKQPRKPKGLFAVQDMAAVYKEIDSGKVTEFLIPGIIVKGGATLMTSPPGAGKTLVAMDLCAAAALPERLWLNRYEFKAPLRCLYIDEDSINGDEFNARVKAMKIPASTNIRRTMLAGIHLDDPAHVDEIIGMCDDDRTELLVIDSLSGVHRGDENSAKDMARVREGLQKICSQGITVVILHHDTKAADSGGVSRQNRGRGSTSIPAMVTSTLHLTKDRDKKDTFVMMPGKERSRDKHAFEGLRITIRRDEQQDRLLLDGLPLGEDEVVMAPALLTSDNYQTRVKAALETVPDGLNKTDLYKAVKGKKESVEEALAAMGDAITVTKEGKASIYRLAQGSRQSPFW